MAASRVAIRLLEELSMNAWPAVRQVVMDGWVVRFSQGYTRRANSVNPLYRGVKWVEEKVQRCEAMYGELGLPTVFKITDASEPVGLEGALDLRGYKEEGRTSVQVKKIGAEVAAEDGVVGFEGVNDRWLDALEAFSPSVSGKRELLGRMLGMIVPERRFAMVVEGGKAVSIGLAVVERGHVGVFDVVTHPEHRRKGYGTRLIRHLMAWGKGRGAERAYLQVMLQNEAALKLYERMGFREHHRYVYRIKGPSSSVAS